MANAITWGGVTSTSLSIVVEKAKELGRPARKVQRYSVPGRNGDIIIQEDAWENYEQKYDVWSGEGTYGSAASDFMAISSWLNGTNGYQELSDDEEPGYFRLAQFIGPLDIDNVLTKFGRATISFDCRPERFLTTGKTVSTFTADGSISNPTVFAAKPIIRVEGDGSSGTVTIGNITFSLVLTEDPLIIDCETMMVRDENGVIRNGYYSQEDYAFPVLSSGTNEVSFTGGVNKVEITPRWFVI